MPAGPSTEPACYSAAVNAGDTSTARPGSGANRPVEIVQQGRQAIRIAWEDGHESTFPCALLRHLCRCAGCRADEPSPATPSNPFRVLGPEPSADPELLEPVGNYALGVTWRDRHSSIFAFDALRASCPCPTCTQTRKRAESSPQNQE